jgi:hypothetical protein
MIQYDGGDRFVGTIGVAVCSADERVEDERYLLLEGGGCELKPLNAGIFCKP